MARSPRHKLPFSDVDAPAAPQARRAGAAGSSHQCRTSEFLCGRTASSRDRALDRRCDLTGCLRAVAGRSIAMRGDVFRHPLDDHVIHPATGRAAHVRAVVEPRRCAAYNGRVRALAARSDREIAGLTRSLHVSTDLEAGTHILRRAGCARRSGIQTSTADATVRAATQTGRHIASTEDECGEHQGVGVAISRTSPPSVSLAANRSWPRSLMVAPLVGNPWERTSRLSIVPMPGM
jgi:hypothetical protein